jgi:hypothetical protein
MAETSELVLTLAAIGEYENAEIIFSWLGDKRYDDGSYWMGVTFPDGVIWPEEKTSWTAAAVLLAYDALNNLTDASVLFNHRFWSDQGFGAPTRTKNVSLLKKRKTWEMPFSYADSTPDDARG